MAAGEGSAVGAGTAAAGYIAAAAGFGYAATFLATGGASAALTMGASAAGDYALKKPINPNELALSGSLSFLTGGALDAYESSPELVGPFNAGEYAMTEAANESISTGVQFTSQAELNRNVASQRSNSEGGGSVIGQLESILSQLQGILSTLQSEINNSK